MIITVGLLFLLQEVNGGFYNFANTYPAILIVVGCLMLFSGVAPSDGHIDSVRSRPAPPSASPPASAGETLPSSRAPGI